MPIKGKRDGKKKPEEPQDHRRSETRLQETDRESAAARSTPDPTAEPQSEANRSQGAEVF